MKKHITLPFVCLVSLLVVNVAQCAAQDEQYFQNTWYDCDMGGNQTVWHVKRYKEGVSWINKMVDDRGTITFSDGCVEIDCNHVQMHFPAKEYKRVSDNIFTISRSGEDDYFDHIEVITGEGREKGMYRVLLAKLDPDGTLQNTHIFVCTPQVLAVGRSEAEARASKGVSVGWPKQVRKK